MKFAQKLVCIILLVLGVSFAAGGSVLLCLEFEDRLAQADAQNAAAHRLACYTLESELLARQSRGDDMTAYDVADYAWMLDDVRGGNRGPGGLALLRDDGGSGADDPVLFEGLPAETAVEDAVRRLGNGERMAVRYGDTVVALYRSHVYGAYALVTGYDLTELYANRTRSLQRYLLLEAAVFVCAAAVAVLASRWVTRPLAALTEASAQIAAGAYDRRTTLRSGDELGRLSASFDAMAAAVQEKVAALELGIRQRQDFMAAFSHELKTPMTSIIGYADMLRSMQVPPEEQREAAAAIFHEGQRLETLSRKLLALMELDEAGLQLAPVPMEAALETLRQAVPPPLDCPPCPAIVLGDADLLADLLYNLVLNARRAGGTARVRCAPADGRLAVTVADDGCGIPPEELGRVLEPFYMVDKSRARHSGGSGLGLALCQRIARAHGSELALQSTPGKGTVVSFTLALAPALPAAPAAEKGAAP